MERTITALLKNVSVKYSNINYLNEKTDHGWEGTTFKQTEHLSNIIAVALLQLNIKPADKVAILSEGRTKWVISEYAIFKTKAVSVPLSVKLSAEDILFRLNHSESKIIFTSHNHVEKIFKIYKNLQNTATKIIYFDTDTGYVFSLTEKYNIPKKNILFYDKILEQAQQSENQYFDKLNTLIASIKENDVINISYTSGTTGNPKGIMLTHLNYYSNIKGSVELVKVEEKSRIFIVLPIDHSFAHTTAIFAGLLKALKIYFLDTRGGQLAALKNIPINIKETKPNLMLTVPALSGNCMKNIIAGIKANGKFVEKIFNSGLKAAKKIYGNGYEKTGKLTKAIYYPAYITAEKLIFSKIRENFGGELKFCIGGGALLDIKQQEFFYAIGMPVFQGYGLSEASPVISSNTLEIHKLGTSGKVLDNIECKIIDDGKEMPTGEKGEIFIKGKNIMAGYYKNPEASAEVLRDGGLYTGDLGYFDEDGFLVVTGRAKALLISEDGEKYSPEEIEETFNNYELIAHTVLYNDHSKYTTAIFDLDEQAIKNFIKRHKIKSAEELLKIFEKEAFSHVSDDKFPHKWLPSIFRFAPEHFSEDNKMINSTMKIVRYKVYEAFADLINQMYQPNTKNDKTHNLKILKKYFD